MILKNLFATYGTKRKEGGKKTKKNGKKRTSPRCLIIKRVRKQQQKNVKVPPLLADEGGSPRGAWSPPLSLLRAEFPPSVETAKISLCFWVHHIRAPRKHCSRYLDFSGERAGSPMTPLAEAEAQATHARPSRSPGGCQSPTRCGYPGTSQPRDGKQGRLSGGVRQQRLGAHGRSGTPHGRGRAPLGARFFPTPHPQFRVSAGLREGPEPGASRLFFWSPQRFLGPAAPLPVRSAHATPAVDERGRGLDSYTPPTYFRRGTSQPRPPPTFRVNGALLTRRAKPSGGWQKPTSTLNRPDVPRARRKPPVLLTVKVCLPPSPLRLSALGPRPQGRGRPPLGV